MTRPFRPPVPTPAEVAAAAAVVRRHLHFVLREDRGPAARKPLSKPEYQRALQAFRMMEALERSKEASRG